MRFGARAQQLKPVNNTIGISGNSRYLTKGGSPWFIIGDTAWSLCMLSIANATTYLNDRKNKGFNAIIMNLMEAHFWPTAPSNANGDSPFTGTAFQSTPRAAFFDHCANIIKLAADRDIVLLISPVYSGFGEGTEGWATEINAATNTQMEDFGKFVGSRFGGFNNIIWTIGGDANPSTTHQARLSAFTTGLLSTDNKHLLTAHWAPESTAGDFPGVVSVNLDTIYTYSTTLYNQAIGVYNNTPIKPYIMFESNYENEHSVTQQALRAQAYWPLMNGACGQIFGNDPMWFFGISGDGNPGHSFSDSVGSWTSSLNTSGAQAMSRLATLFANKAWHLLVPDTSNSAMTAGHSTGTSLAACSVASDKSLLMAYLPTSRQVTINMAAMKSSSLVRWVEGSTGTITSEGNFSNSGSQNFTPPGAGDWILLIEAS